MTGVTVFKLSMQSRINNYGVSWFWEETLPEYLTPMNLEFEDIWLIEEIIPYILYTAYIKVKSHSKYPEFIEISVTFNKRCIPILNITPTIVNEIRPFDIEGRLLLDRRGLP